MRYTIYILLCFLTCLSAHAQNKKHISHPGGRYSIYRLELTDKKGSTGDLSHPENLLSYRALQRRFSQGIRIDSTDLPVSAMYKQAIRSAGFTIVGGSRWMNTVLVRVKHEKDITAASTLPFVRKVTRIYQAPDSITPELPEELTTLPLPTPSQSSRYGRAQQQIRLFNGDKLHEAGFTGRGVVVAIVDGGFMNANRIPLLSNVEILGARDFVYPYRDNVYDLLDHGTMVLSNMAMKCDSFYVGTAPDAAYWLLRSEYGPTEQLAEEDWWVQAVEFADSVGADVINSSLGYNVFDLPDQNHTYREQNGRTALISRAASLLADKGIVLVNSAGNEGRGTWKKIKFPADAEDILTVAAIDRDSVNASFSSVGPAIDGRVKPDVASMGVAAAVVDGTGEITTANGTSFASPILCGMVACMRQAFPTMPAKELMQHIRQSADRADCPDNIYGYGVPDFWKAYQSAKQP